MKNHICLTVFLLIAACNPEPVSEISSTSAPVPTGSLTQAVLPTSTVVPTSAPSYPVLAGTPLPLQLSKIMVQNANSLITFGRYGGEADVVWTKIDSVKDTNHGVITSSMTLPPSEWHCPIESGYSREPKVFVGTQGEVAIVTQGKLEVYEDGIDTPFRILPLQALKSSTMCPMQLHSVRVSGDMKLAAVATENSIDIYSIETGQLITSLENMKYPRLFSVDSKYFAAGNDGDQLSIYSTDHWKKIATIFDVIPYAKTAVIGFSVDNKSFVVEKLDGTATIYNLQDGVSYESICVPSENSCSNDMNNLFNVVFDAFLLNHTYMGNVDYYFGQDGSSLLVTRSFDVENEISDETPKFSAIIEEICLERKSGEKIQCITPPEEGFPLDQAGNETFCWEKVLGMELCEHIQPDGVFTYVDVNCDDPANCDSADFVTSISYKTQVSQDELPARIYELCILPLDSASICSQRKTSIFSNTKQVYTLRTVSDTKKEIYLEGEGSEKLIATIDHKPSYASFFDPIPLITITPDQKYLIYATEYVNPASFSYEQIVHILDLTAGREMTQLSGQFAQTTAVSPNSRFLGFTRRGLGLTGIAILDLDENSFVLNKNAEVSPAITFSPNSDLLVFIERNDAEMGRINFYSIEAEEIEKQIDLDLTGSDVSAIAFSPGGELLAVGFTDGDVRLFDVQLGTEIYTLIAHIGQVKWLEFSANGQLLLTVGSIDQYAKIWGVLP